MPDETFHRKNYIQYRWTSERNRFAREARLYRGLNIVMIVLALLAVAGALVASNVDPRLPMTLFALALVAVAVNVLYDFNDRANRARNVAEALRREHELFNSGVGAYGNADRAFDRFVRRSEAIIEAGSTGYVPLPLSDEPEPETRQPRSPLPPSNPFGSRSSSSSSSSAALRSRLSSSRFATASRTDDDDDDHDDDDDDDVSSRRSSRSRFGGSPFGGRSSSGSGSSFGNRSGSSSGSPFGNRPANSPFGSNARYSGGRPIGSSGGMRREGNDDPALAGIQTGNGNTGMRFTVYYPKELLPNEWQPIKAYAYLGYAVDAIAVDAEGGDPGKVPEIIYDRNRSARYRIPEGSHVTVTPRMKGFQFNPHSVNIGFYRTWHRFDFEMRAVNARLDEATNGYLTFTVDGLVVADVPMSVYVARGLNRNENDMTRRVTRRPYRSVYASFADEDAHLAARLRRIYDALGMYNMRDLMQLREENGWNEDMLKTIEDAEAFQLFWSEAAAHSDAVARELHGCGPVA
ncbi:MAG: DUF4231 domain-containing protein, partial [Chloroflexota bacterium]